MKYGLVKSSCELGPASWLCSALSVSRSGYYEWRSRKPSERAKTDRRLLLEIRASYEESKRVYGSPRIVKDLRGSRLYSKREAGRSTDAGCWYHRSTKASAQTGAKLRA